MAAAKEKFQPTNFAGIFVGIGYNTKNAEKVFRYSTVGTASQPLHVVRKVCGLCWVPVASIIQSVRRFIFGYGRVYHGKSSPSPTTAGCCAKLSLAGGDFHFGERQPAKLDWQATRQRLTSNPCTPGERLALKKPFPSTNKYLFQRGAPKHGSGCG